MSLFKSENPVLGRTTKVDMSNSATVQYAVQIPPFIDEVTSFVGTTAANVVCFINPVDPTTYGSYKLVKAYYTIETSAAAGATLDLWQANSGSALSAGASLLNAAININTATLVTPAAMNVTPTTLAAGQRIAMVVAGTLTGLTGLTVELLLERVG